MAILQYSFKYISMPVNPEPTFGMAKLPTIVWEHNFVSYDLKASICVKNRENAVFCGK